MVPDSTYDEYAYRIGDKHRTKQLDQFERANRTGSEERLQTNRFDTGAKRGASANIVDPPRGPIISTPILHSTTSHTLIRIWIFLLFK